MELTGERKTTTEMLRESAHRAVHEMGELEDVMAALERAGAKLERLRREEYIDSELPVEFYLTQLETLVAVLREEHEGAEAFWDDVMVDIDGELGR